MTSNVNNSQRLLQKRRFLLALPLLITPFLTLGFWALSGGNTSNTLSEKATGLNLQLPDAQFREEKGSDKLSAYEQADRQEETHSPGNQKDYFSLDNAPLIPLTDSVSRASLPFHTYDKAPSSGSPETSEAEIYQKLAQLKEQLQQASTPAAIQDRAIPSLKTASEPSTLMEQNPRQLHAGNTKREEDPELRELSSMMDKILDIQHPERVKERMKEQAQQHQFPISKPQDRITLLATLSSNKVTDPVSETFYSLETPGQTATIQTSPTAVVHGSQKVTSGSTVKLRLLEDFFSSGVTLPKGQLLYGRATLSGDRLIIHISSIRLGNQLLPLDLSVYDLDGQEGISLPGTSTGEDVAGEITERAVQGLELGTLDHSALSNITRAGLEASKSLFIKKRRLVKVMLPAGYQVLLRDNTQQR